MRTYLILRHKAELWNTDKEIKAILNELSRDGKRLPSTGKYSKKGAEALLAHSFDKDAILRKRLPYERLDQLTVDILAGVR
jgi:xylose isomerase